MTPAEADVYINAAATPAERHQRKAETFSIRYAQVGIPRPTTISPARCRALAVAYGMSPEAALRRYPD